MNYISYNNLFKFLDGLKNEYEVYTPFKNNKQRFYKRYEAISDDIVIGEVRAFEPLKPFFYKARERMQEGFSADIPRSKNKPFEIVGVKACDLKGFQVQDYVFKDHDYEDPFYMRMRRENLIISAECTCAIETCFCLALGLKPYPQNDFDINLSSVNGGFIAEPGSEKGNKLIGQYSHLFEEVKPTHILQKNEQRNTVAKQVEKNIKNNEIPCQESYKGAVEKSFESGIWKEEANTCVECGACNTICPTCHCFLLYDQKDKRQMARLRIWDSCLIKDFARVAGGANPRKILWMRLRNRFEKKFDFFPKVADVYACTGCGRCISACPGKIDIRRVLKNLVKNA